MHNKIICFILSLTVVYLAESTPVKLGALEFDNLDTDLSDLRYEVEEEDMDDFSKYLDTANSKSKLDFANNKDSTKSTTNITNSGLKKKSFDKAGVKGNYNIADLKQILKLVGVHDLGTFDIADVFALAKGLAAAAIGTSGNESRNYRKGTKTRGFHQVHHKDEYKKDQEFYEDDEIKGTFNKIGAKAKAAKIGAGAGFDKGYFHYDRQKGLSGKQGYLGKGYLDAEFNKYLDSQIENESDSKDN